MSKSGICQKVKYRFLTRETLEYQRFYVLSKKFQKSRHSRMFLQTSKYYYFIIFFFDFFDNNSNSINNQ